MTIWKTMRRMSIGEVGRPREHVLFMPTELLQNLIMMFSYRWFRLSSYLMGCYLIALTTDTFSLCLPVFRDHWPLLGLRSQCSQQVWSMTTLAWESLRLGLGRDWTPSVIFRTLSPICILSVVGHYFVSSAIIFLFVLYKLYSWLVRVVLYMFSVIVVDYRDLL